MTRLQFANLALALMFCLTLLPTPSGAQIEIRPPVQGSIDCKRDEVGKLIHPPNPPIQTPQPISYITGPLPKTPSPNIVTDVVDQYCQKPQPGPQTYCPPTCPPPQPSRVQPLFPAPASTGNRILESIATNTTIPLDSRNDVDGDGIPNPLDAVNLASEANANTTTGDYLSFTDGLPQAGFAILIEPSHHEAQLVVADPTSTLPTLANLTSDMTAQQALNLIQSLQGIQARNAFANVLHDGMSIKHTPIVPEAPWNQTLTWSTTLPADGSWLLIHTDPTRLLDLTLAGNPVSLAARAASHFSSTLNSTDYRWQFLNLHSDSSFCYDPATAHNGTDCTGNQWPGWIRAYSGQAAYTLDAVRSGLATGTIPLTTLLPPATQKVVGESCPTGTVGFLLNGQGVCIPLDCPLDAPLSMSLGELESSIGMASLLTAQQASQANLTLPTTLPASIHATPQEAAAELAARHNVTLPPSALASFAALTAPEASALAHLLDAFMDFEDATHAAYQNQDVDYGLIYAARNRFMLSIPEFAKTTSPVSQPPGLDACPAFALDLAGTDTTYTTNCALVVDVGGNDAYQNNAGGSSLSAPYCAALTVTSAAAAAAVIDLAGNDAYSSRGCGVNGGGYNGVGFLLDAAGDDTYPSGSLATNGGGQLGAGFLLDVAGDDTYTAQDGGTNGGAWAGFGVLLDRAGDDTYTATGYGGNGGGYTAGSGLLVDLDGDDTYTATDHGANGAGEGGIGLLLDVNGVDEYADNNGGTGVDKTVAPKGTGAQIDVAPCSLLANSPQSEHAASAAPASLYHVKLPLMDPESSWQVLGNQSYAFPTGVGIDYTLDAVGVVSQASMVTQVADSMLSNATNGLRAASQRLFKFQGAYYSMPASPRSLTSVRLGIQSIDGNEAAQTFLVDGKRIHDLLDLRGNDTLVVRIDDAHKAGFEWVATDINLDGAMDLIVKIPHFSAAWLTLSNSNTDVDFLQVKMTSDTTGWIAGAAGAVYRYDSGALTRYDVYGTGGSIRSDQRTFGLSVKDDTDFYVAGGCSSDSLPFIAHYHSSTHSQGAFTLMPVPSDLSCGNSLAAVWVNPTGTVGYAGGRGGIWLRYDGTSWSRATSPTRCDIQAIQFDAYGHGLVALFSGYYCSTTGSILSYDGTTFSNIADASTQGITTGILGPTEFWATGVACQTDHHWDICSREDRGILQLVSGTWKRSTESGAPNNPMTGVDKATATSLWFVGSASCGCAKISNRNAGTWTSVPLSDSLPGLDDVSFGSSFVGLAVGYSGAIMQFEEYASPVPAGTLSSLTTDTVNSITGDGSGSSTPTGGSLTHYWDWGDGTYSTGATASHRYNSISVPGTFTVTYKVVDTKTQRSATQTWPVTVDALSFTLGSTVSDYIFGEPGTGAAIYYKIPAIGSDRAVAITVPTTRNFALGASLDQGPPAPGMYYNSGTWPRSVQGSSASDGITGKIPAGKTLYFAVERPGAWAHTWYTSYTVTVTQVTPPGNPTTTLGAGLQHRSVYFDAATPAGTRPTRLVVNWGDGATENYPNCACFYQGTQNHPDHTYAQTGAYTVTLSTLDDTGQSASITRAITVYDNPRATATGADSINAVQATLHGHLGVLGGPTDGSYTVTAWYVVFTGYNRVATGPAMVMSSTADLPAWTVTGLTSGASYYYQVTVASPFTPVENTWSNAQVFQTNSPLTITPVISGNAAVNLGGQSSLSLTASASSALDVAYLVTWDTGMPEVRYPPANDPAPYRPWNQAVTATTTYAFAGTHLVSVRLQDSASARSNPTTANAVVNGAGPVSSFSGTNDATTVTLSAGVGSLAMPASTQMHFSIQDPVTNVWTNSSWVTNPTSPQTWQTGALDAAKTYPARVEFRTTGTPTQTWSTAVGSYLMAHPNRFPVLQATTTPVSINYLDSVRFAVTYSDAEGDAPRNSPGALANPVLVFNGATYSMIGSGASYASGVEYFYMVPASSIPADRNLQPEFKAWDQYGRLVSTKGAPIVSLNPYAVNLNFEGDNVNGPAKGTVPSGEALNLWHVTDTAGKADRLALGSHGKVLWFGYEGRGTYDDPQGGVPKGSMSLVPLNLVNLKEPTLSFSSYYETEDERASFDIKKVEILGDHTKTVVVQGLEGGFGAWRSQAIDLREFTDQIVTVRFTFDAVDNQYNGHMGWFLDDIALGHDHDTDTLPDILETSRLQTTIRTTETSTLVPPGTVGSSFILNYEAPGAEAIVVEAIISSQYCCGELVSLQAIPGPGFTSEPARDVFSINLATDQVTACGATSTASGYAKAWYGQQGKYVTGAPYGYPNPPLSTTRPAPVAQPFNGDTHGVRLQVDVTDCLRTGALTTTLPQALQLSVQARSDASATIEEFRVSTWGRTSMFDADSHGIGATDVGGRPDSVATRGSVGLDLNGDSVPSRFKVMPDYSPVVPSIFVEFPSSTVNRVKIALQRDEAQKVSMGFNVPVISRYTRGNTQDEWLLDTSKSFLVIASWTDTQQNAGRMEVDFSANRLNSIDFQFDTASVKAVEKWRYDAPLVPPSGTNPFEVIVGGHELYSDVQDPAKLTKILTAQRPLDSAETWEFGKGQLIDFAVDHVLSYLSLPDTIIDTQLKGHEKATCVHNAAWTDTWQHVQGERCLGETDLRWYDGLSQTALLTAIQNAAGPKLGQGAYRWFYPDPNTGKTVLLTSDYAGRFAGAWQLDAYQDMNALAAAAYPGLLGDPVEKNTQYLASVENAVAQTLYNAGPYDHRLCLYVCGQPGNFTSTLVWDPAVAPNHVNPSQASQVMGFQVPGGVLSALRAYQWSMTQPGNHGLDCCDALAGQNALGVHGILYAFRYARDDPNGKRPEFGNHWGSEDCRDDPAQRKCLHPGLGNDLGHSIVGEAAPFTMTWSAVGEPTLTDNVGVSGVYRDPGKNAAWNEALERTLGLPTTDLGKDFATQALDSALVGSQRAIVSFDAWGYNPAKPSSGTSPSAGFNQYYAS
ncbi:MAG: PKD domain-containing protein [Halobacteriales archaeon]|nr:PKD domain-containing protein [Halobacteriales archaeon]